MSNYRGPDDLYDPNEWNQEPLSEEPDVYEDPYGDPSAEPEESWDDTYEEPAYYDDEEIEEAPPPRPRHREAPRLAVISTNATINLTCLLAAACGLFGLFFYFADRKSRAVRRTAVQSAALFIVTSFVTALLWIFATLLGSIPFIGGVLGGLLWVCWFLFFALVCVARWRLALNAYRGLAYVLPVIGASARSFE